MSTSYIPEKVKVRLWGKAGGRCQYSGCNKPLWFDTLTKTEFNTAYIAHIVADSPKGPRGDSKLSEKLKAEISNLMILCDEHHRLIDREQVDEHPVDRLTEMKIEHEKRIETLTEIQPNKKSYIITYGANTGKNSTATNFERVVQAIVPNWYPAEKTYIELGFKNSSFSDHEADFWKIERENLIRQFNNTIKPRLESGELHHLSVFALAPQPLLMELGRLLSDIPAAEIFQLHREPPNWQWQNSDNDLEYIVHKNIRDVENVALNLSLSGTITDDRIESIIGKNCSIWTMTIEDPNNDFIQDRWHLQKFRQRFRRLLDNIKKEHGQNTPLHIFPTMPVSCAFDLGRVWMPKADMPLKIYDQNSKQTQFLHAFNIDNKED